MVYLNLENGGSDEVVEEEGSLPYASPLPSQDGPHERVSVLHCSGQAGVLYLAECFVFLSTWKYSQGSRPACFPSRIMASGVLPGRSADGHSYLGALSYKAITVSGAPSQWASAAEATTDR